MTARTLLLFLLACSAASAQTHKPAPKNLPPSAFKLKAVKVTGSTRYKPDDINRAIGMQIGQTIHEDDLKEGVRVLGESGAFTGVAYTFEYSVEGTEVEWKLQDTDKLVPVRFENLVWFSAQELSEQLHAQVPLFTGELPINGRLVNQVSEALQAMVVEKKVAGEVDFTRVGAEDGPTQAFAFEVTGPHITVGNVEFSNSDPALLPILQRAAKSIEDNDYVCSTIRKQEDKLFLPIYQEHGYLKAEFGDPQAKVTQTDGQEVTVDVTIPIVPGKQYKVESLSVAGEKAIPEAELNKALLLQVNQPANTEALNNSVAAIQHLYGAHGYMASEVKVDAQIDDAHATVRYQFQVAEGPVYTMGDLDVHAPDSRTRSQLETAWKLRSGDTYDSGYPARYVAFVFKQVLTTGEWEPNIHETLNPDKTVDVTVRFDQK